MWLAAFFSFNDANAGVVLVWVVLGGKSCQGRLSSLTELSPSFRVPESPGHSVQWL